MYYCKIIIFYLTHYFLCEDRILGFKLLYRVVSLGQTVVLGIQYSTVILTIIGGGHISLRYSAVSEGAVVSVAYNVQQCAQLSV